MLVLDASSSMLSNDADGLRIDAAKTAARGLIERTPDGTHPLVLLPMVIILVTATLRKQRVATMLRLLGHWLR